MIVISDTTPLISLMKIGHLKLVNQLFGEIQVPEAVYNELISNPHFNEEAREIRESDFIKRVHVDDEKAVDLLRRITGLDMGESEAIILSDTCKADLLLMDEVKGRHIAQQMGIRIMGTIGLLMIAYEEELLSSEEIVACVECLRNAGRHISNKLFEQLMEKIGGQEG
jgi:predicted nucleic acid-binding protein